MRSLHVTLRLLVLLLVGSLFAAGSATAATSLKFSFGPDATATPLGYTRDNGSAWTDAAGRGWVDEKTLANATHTPLNMTGQTRARNKASNPLDDTLIQTSPTTALHGSFEVAVPNGTYRVKVRMGDASYTNSIYDAKVEGTTVINQYVPSTGGKLFTDGTADVPVTDGRLTLSTAAGSNGKLNYIEISDAPVQPTDTTPPAVPANLTATASASAITTMWNPVTDTDLAGYDVYRSTSSTVPTTPGTALNGTTRLTDTSFVDTTAATGTDYYYAVTAVDKTGNVSAASSTATARISAAPATSFSTKVNFQPAGTAPAGYVAETGAPYSDARGQGFVTEASLSSVPHVPVDASAGTRKRGVANADPRLDTIQQLVPATGAAPVAWEAKVPNGTYTVTVAAGDLSYYNSKYVVSVEGQTLINKTPTSSARSFIGTSNTIRVTDGRLTVDGIGSTNGKLQYIDINSTSVDTAPVPAPATPTGVTVSPTATQVNVGWTPNTESDLAGYYVYRSTVSPVDVSSASTPLNGNLPVTANSYVDLTATAGATYYYAVVAANSSGGRSGASDSVKAVIPQPQLDKKFNFEPTAGPRVTGWTVEDGSPFTDAKGYGWIREDSVPLSSAEHVPYSFVDQTRTRNKVADKRFDTLIHMQQIVAGADHTKGAWELAVPNGAYDVSVGVGDAAYINSRNVITIEGQRAVNNFVPTPRSLFLTESATVNVSDGRLTVDATSGDNTKLDWVRVQSAPEGPRPGIGKVLPSDGSTLVSRGRAVTADVVLTAGGGVDGRTINNDSVRLERASDGLLIPANVNTSAAGDVVSLQPTDLLEPNTRYRFVITNLLRDVSGTPFIPKTTTFTTGTTTGASATDVRFSQEGQASSAGNYYASLVKGPDGKLYATTLDGNIFRFPIGADGTLGTPDKITTIADHELGPRNVVGIAFDPASTADNLVVWVTHGTPAYNNNPDWSGKISKLWGPNLENIQDEVVGLPRSVRDHQTNSVAFGPDGALYLTQGSNSAMGAPDNAWGLRPEHALNAAVLRLDPSKITQAPLDVQTEDGGTYDPFAANAPLTIYASGVRNAYDLVWHRNGQLYSPVNGSAAGGSTPGTPSTLPAACSKRIDSGTAGAWTGPSVPATDNVPSQPDLLLRIQQNKYYGHPNPARCEYSFFAGNPTTGDEFMENPLYPAGTKPDRNFVPNSFSMGDHFSPDGAIEYKSSTLFNGELDGSLMVVRYSAGDDVVALKIDPNTKEVVSQVEGIPGLRGLSDPVDLAEDDSNGNLYVSELGKGQITLLRPDQTAGAPKAAVTPTKVIDNAAIGANSRAHFTLTNSGNADLIVTKVEVNGPQASEFTATNYPTLPATVKNGTEFGLDVTFAPTAAGIRQATVSITTNDPVNPVLTVPLKGLGHVGEASLQRIADLYDYAINVGDDDPATAELPAGALLGAEVPGQTFTKADGVDAVGIKPIASFGTKSTGSTVATFGWHAAGDASDRHSVFSVPSTWNGNVDPVPNGASSFDPGSDSFGLYTNAVGVPRVLDTQDALNTFSGAATHQARVYELRDNTGAVVPHSYLVAFEEAAGTPTATGLDYNDQVVVLTGVDAEGAGGGRVKLSNPQIVPFANRLVMSRIGSLAAPATNSVWRDKSTVNVKNTGNAPLTITALPITGPFRLVSPTTLPVTVAPGASTPITVQFIAESGRTSTGKLTVTTDSATTPTTDVDLAGFWQSKTENGEEPRLEEIVRNLFGYGTTIVGVGDHLNGKGHVEVVGDEVLAPYWRQVDSDRPVRVTQIAAYHGVDSSSELKWFMKGGSKTRAQRVMVQGSKDGQTVFPRLSGTTTGALTTATFSPTASFGMNVGAEWSDPLLNGHATDISNGCTEPCGHHMRAWPAKTKDGATIPGTYIFSMDYSGINYDYQDNVYVMSNVEPDNGSLPLIRRIDTGSATTFTRSGISWGPDTGLFSPSTAISEGTSSDPIDNTADDKMYATYRGNVAQSDQTKRILKYSIPTDSATSVDVRLYFAERYWTAANKRIFDVQAEGVTRISNLDLFARSGGTNVAWSTVITDVPVFDGNLDLSFIAKTDYPAISGMEILCHAGCAAD